MCKDEERNDRVTARKKRGRSDDDKQSKFSTLRCCMTRRKKERKSKSTSFFFFDWGKGLSFSDFQNLRKKRSMIDHERKRRKKDYDGISTGSTDDIRDDEDVWLIISLSSRSLLQAIDKKSDWTGLFTTLFSLSRERREEGGGCLLLKVSCLLLFPREICLSFSTGCSKINPRLIQSSTVDSFGSTSFSVRNRDRREEIQFSFSISFPWRERGGKKVLPSLSPTVFSLTTQVKKEKISLNSFSSCNQSLWSLLPSFSSSFTVNFIIIMQCLKLFMLLGELAKNNENSSRFSQSFSWKRK